MKVILFRDILNYAATQDSQQMKMTQAPKQ